MKFGVNARSGGVLDRSNKDLTKFGRDFIKFGRDLVRYGHRCNPRQISWLNLKQQTVAHNKARTKNTHDKVERTTFSFGWVGFIGRGETETDGTDGTEPRRTSSIDNCNFRSPSSASLLTKLTGIVRLAALEFLTCRRTETTPTSILQFLKFTLLPPT